MPGWPSKPPAGWPLDRASPHCRGVVAFWSMNEGAGSRLNDLSGLGNDLLFDTVPPLRRGAAWGHGVATDGTDDQRAVNTNARGLPVAAAAGWTLEVRAAITANNNNNFLVGFGDWTGAVDGTARMFWVNSGNYGFWGASADWNAAGAVDTDGKPHHLFLTSDGITLRFYRDGVFVSSVGIPGLLFGRSATAQCILGGNHPGTNGTLTARWDFACIRNVCLSAGEVAARHAAPYAMFAPVPLRRSWVYAPQAASGVPRVMHHRRQQGMS